MQICSVLSLRFILLAIFAFLPVAAHAQERLQWADLGCLTPQQIGEAILGQRSHRVIVDIVRDVHPMVPPQVEALTLFEMPTAVEGGCKRTSWQVSVHVEAFEARTSGLQDTLSKSDYLALNDNSPCLFAIMSR